MSRNAYHLYGNFGEHFPTSGTGVAFFVLKTVMGLKYKIYKITVSFSLSLKRKPGTVNPNKWNRKFGSFR